MPNFYFHIVTPGGREADDIGTPCANAEIAYLEAIRAALEMGADAARSGEALFDHRFEIHDERRRLILEVPFSEAFAQRVRRPPSPADELHARLAQAFERNRAAQAAFAAALSETRATLETTRALLNGAS